jgi:hypothetical protein
MLVVGGSKNPDFKAKTIKEPELSLFLLDMQRNEVLLRRKLARYRNHAAIALLNKKFLFIAGGEFNGEWTDTVTSLKITEPEKGEIQIDPLPRKLFGPSATV